MYKLNTFIKTNTNLLAYYYWLNYLMLKFNLNFKFKPKYLIRLIYFNIYIIETEVML